MDKENIEKLIVFSTHNLNLTHGTVFDGPFNIDASGVEVFYDDAAWESSNVKKPHPLVTFQKDGALYIASKALDVVDAMYVRNFHEIARNRFHTVTGEYPKETYLFHHRKEVNYKGLFKVEKKSDDCYLIAFSHENSMPHVQWLKGDKSKIDDIGLASYVKDYFGLKEQEERLKGELKVWQSSVNFELGKALTFDIIEKENKKDKPTVKEDKGNTDSQLTLVFCEDEKTAKCPIKVRYHPFIGGFDRSQDIQVDDLLNSESSMPILVISPFPLINIVEETKQVEKITPRMIDPRIRFFDSSIWFRFVSIADSTGGTFYAQLDEVTQYFKEAYNQGLYKKNVTKEYRDLHLRLFKQSYISESGDHASAVTPFKFHSEGEMMRKAQNLQKGFKDKNLGWDFLLADDFADKPLRENKDNGTGFTKGELIKTWLTTDTFKCKIEITKWHELDSLDELVAGKFPEADGSENSTQRYDVILLDYLFSFGKKEELPGPRYGTEWIEKLQNANFQARHRGPFNRFWVYPVTVFPDALASDMEFKGWSYITQNYYLARGADPISTPGLFLYSLYRFLKLQYDKVIFAQEDIYEFLRANPIGDGKDIKPWARNTLVVFLERFAMIDTLVGNKSNPTAFENQAAKYLHIGKTDDGVDRIDIVVLVGVIRDLLYTLAYLSDMPINKEMAKRSYDILRDSFKRWVKTRDKTDEELEEIINRIGRFIINSQNNY